MASDESGESDPIESGGSALDEDRESAGSSGWADEPTGVYNIEALRLLAEHQMRVANRTREFLILAFLTLEGLDEARSRLGDEAAERMLAETAEVIRENTRESDVVARTDDASFCVLLTGGAAGAEDLVVSRLVEAVAVRNENRGQAPQLKLTVGTARYDPGHPARLDDLIRRAAPPPSADPGAPEGSASR